MALLNFTRLEPVLERSLGDRVEPGHGERVGSFSSGDAAYVSRETFTPSLADAEPAENSPQPFLHFGTAGDTADRLCRPADIIGL